jgi:hypothetical protein
MFIELNEELANPQPNTHPSLGPFAISALHPLQLSGFVEAVWETWRRAPRFGAPLAPTVPRAVVPGLGRTGDRTTPVPQPFPVLSDPLVALLRSRDSLYPVGGGEVDVDLVNVVEPFLARQLRSTGRGKNVAPLWRHLIYAYLIENTRIIELFQRVLVEALHDESFGTLSDTTFRWLRLTESLFFRDGESSLIHSITSQARPDIRATRRNAYYRMFGMDLNHGGADGGPYPYVKAANANVDFAKTLQDLLRELWRGHINAGNINGPNTTDVANIDELVDRLKNMLNARRISADNSFTNLAREELVAVATAEWFHLAVSFNSSLTEDLNISATTPDERVRQLGERVKLPAHTKARSFFFLAEDLPPLLRQIELGDFDAPGDQEALFRNAGPIRDAVLRIISHWSHATGADLKSIPVVDGAPR